MLYKWESLDMKVVNMFLDFCYVMMKLIVLLHFCSYMNVESITYDTITFVRHLFRNIIL